VWFDGLFDHDRFQPERFHRLVHELQPRALTNDRLGPGDYVTPEQFTPGGIPVRRQGPAPQVTREMIERFFAILTSGRSRDEVEAMLAPGRARAYPTAVHPSAGEVQPWETCMTMNGAWGYVPTDRDWKSPETLVRTLVETASRNGNLLLNVGPRGDGTFPPEAIERLQAVGAWMATHGDAVWGTSHGPVQGHPSVRSTRSGDVVYLEVLDWADGSVDLPGFERRIASMSSLDGAPVSFTEREGRLRISRPAGPVRRGVTVIAARTVAG
jgi:alpha-L-fucosidase